MSGDDQVRPAASADGWNESRFVASGVVRRGAAAFPVLVT